MEIFKRNRAHMRSKYISIALAGLMILGLTKCGDDRDQARERKAKAESETAIYTDKAPDSARLLAYNLASDFVKESLQEPATAEFPNTKEKLKQVIHLGNNRYRINSWVDSQDTYGATTRRKFSCVLRVEASGVKMEEFRIEEYGVIQMQIITLSILGLS